MSERTITRDEYEDIRDRIAAFARELEGDYPAEFVSRGLLTWGYSKIVDREGLAAADRALDVAQCGARRALETPTN